MASEAYIQAAKQTPRFPTTYMSVESAEGQTLYYTTQGQWDGSDTLTDISTDGTQAELGDAVQEYYPQSITTTTHRPYVLPYNGFVVYVQEFTAGYDQFFNNIVHTLMWNSGLQGTTVKARLKITDTNPLTSTPSITHYSDEVTVSPDVVLGGLYYYSGQFDATSIDLDVLNGETWFVSLEYFRTFAPTGWFAAASQRDGVSGQPTPQFATNSVKPTSQVITSAIDFGAVTSSNPIFGVDDVTASGALIAYSYTYSTDDISYTSGGTIVDGSSLVASRYFKIQADFTTTTGGRGKIREIQLKEGIFRYFGSHIDTPFAGVSPQIIPNSVSTLSQKIQIGRGLSTTGESSVRMFWVPEVSDMIASGYLKGKDVAIYSGFVGLPTDAYEPILVGTWYDHDLDEINRVITVKIRDAFKQFEKRKIPEEVVNTSTGAITTVPLTYTTENPITVVKDIFDNIGLRGRYISPDFDTLEIGQYSEAKYKVSRVVSKSTDFNKLLDELSVTMSMYMVPQGNGQIKPKPFNPNIEHTATLDANEIDFVNLKGNISEFFSRFYAYYNPKTTLTADPTDDTDDYDNGTAVIDATAEVNWFPERGTKQHFDKWKVGRAAAATPLTTPPQALTDLMNLWNSLFTEPLYTVSAKKIPPRFANIEPADVIEVDNLDLPVVDNAWVDAPKYEGVNYNISETITQKGSTLSNDGTKLYVVSDTSQQWVYQYTLSTAYNVSTATYDSVILDIGTETSNPWAVVMSDDGMNLYVSDLTTSTIYQYSLTIANDISTATYASKSFIVNEDSNPTGMFIKPDGLKLYVLGRTNDFVYQYTMTTAWDISTASYDSISKSIASEDANGYGLFFSEDGKSMFVNGATNSKIFRYELATPWVLTLTTYTSEFFSYSSEAVSMNGLFMSPDGKTMYTGDTSGTVIYQYTLITPWTLEAISYTEGDRVIHDGFMWRARQDNQGKDPTSEAAFWQNTDISDAGLTVGKHFFVLGRKFNPNQATMELDLMEMPPGTLGGFDSGFSNGFNL